MKKSVVFLCVLVMLVMANGASADLITIAFSFSSGSNEQWGNYSIGDVLGADDGGSYEITAEKMVTVTLDENWTEYSDYSRTDENIAANARVNTEEVGSPRTFQVRDDTVGRLQGYVSDMNTQYDYLFTTIDEITFYNGQIAEYMSDIVNAQDKPHPEYMDKLAYWKREKFETETIIDDIKSQAESDQGVGVPGWFSVYSPPSSQ